MIRVELERVKHQREQRRQEANLMTEVAERLFLDKRSNLHDSETEQVVREMLSRARVLCLDDDVDLQRIQAINDAVQGILEGKRYSSEDIQLLIGRRISVTEAAQIETKPTQTVAVPTPAPVIPPEETDELGRSIYRVLNSLSTDQLNHLLAEALSPLGLVAPGSVISNEPRLKERFVEARHHYQTGDFGRARVAFLELHNSLPLYARRESSPVSPALFNAAASALAVDQHDKVIELLENSRNALFGVPLWHLGVAYYGTERLDDALSVVLEWTQRAKASRVPTFYGYYTAGLLSWMLRDRSEALTLMRSAWDEDPNYVRGRLQMVPAKQPPHRLPPSVRVAEEIYERAKVILEEILTPRPPDRYTHLSMAGSIAQAAIGRAIERVGEGDTEGALEQLLRIEAQGTAIAPLSWAIGACQLLLGDTKSAVGRLSEGREHLSLPGSVLWNLTVARFRIADVEGARLSLQQCTDKEFSTSPKAWLIRGLLAYLCGDNEDARNAVRRSARFSEAARTQVAVVLDRIEDPQLLDALPELSTRRLPELVERKEEPKEPPELLERFQEAIRQASEIRAGDFNKRSAVFAAIAPVALEEVLEAQLTPFEIAFLDNLPPSTPSGVLANTFLDAVRAYRDGRFIESADLFTRYVESMGDLYAGFLDRGCALLRAGRVNDAVTAFEQAAELRGQDGYAWWNLAVALREREDLEDALEALRQERQCDVQLRFTRHNLNLALLAQEVGDKEIVATALYDACRLSESPSVSLRCCTIRACRDVRDWERVIALLSNFIHGKELPQVIAGVTRPRETPEECRTLEDMEANYLRFSQSQDRRAAVDFFGRVENLRLQEAGQERAAAAGKESAIYALLYHGFALSRYEQPFDAAARYTRALELLDQHRDAIGGHSYAAICSRLAEKEIRFHPVFALRVVRRGLDALPKDARAEATATDLENHRERAMRRIPPTWLKGTDLALESVPERLRHPISNASTKELAQHGLGLLEYAAQVLGGPRKEFSRVMDLSQDIVREIASFEEQPFSARHRRHSEISEKLRQLAVHIQLDMPDRGMPVFQEALRVFNDSVGALSKEVPAVEVSPPEDYAWFRDDELTTYVQVRNKGAALLQDIELRLSLPKSKDLFWLPEPTRRLSTLKPDDVRWVEWELVFNELPQESTDSISLSVEVSAQVPQLMTESYRESFRVSRLPQVFRDITVSYPAGALKPGQVEELWGRAQMLRDMRRTITRAGQSRIYFLEGVRKVGKTSIMYFLADEMSPDSLWTYVNFDTSWDNLYERISQGVRESLREQRLQVEIADFRDAQTFRSSIEQLLRASGKQRLLLLFDEFGSAAQQLASVPRGAAFLGDLRDIFNSFSGRIAVILADFRLLRELQRVLPAQIWADVQRLPVNFLDSASARDAILGPIRGDERISFEREAIQRAIWYTGGYPWHLQQLCSNLMGRIGQRLRYRVLPQDVDEEANRLIEEDHLFEEGLCRPGRIEDADRPILATLARLTDEAALDRPVEAKALVSELGLASQEEALRGRIAQLCSIGVLHSERRDYSSVRFSTPLLAAWSKKQERGGGFASQPSLLGQPVSVLTERDGVRVVPPPLQRGTQFSEQLTAIAKGLRYQSREITTIDLDAWLLQFPEEQWRHFALKMLKRCRDRYYYDEATVRSKLQHLWQKAVTWLQKRPEFQRIPEKELVRDHVWFACLGKASKSEDLMLRLLRQECEIPSERVVDDWYKLLRDAKEQPTETVVIVVDDFIGTGSNLVDKMNNRLRDAKEHFETGEDSLAWIETWFQQASLLGLVVAGCSEGIAYIGEQLEGKCHMKLMVEDVLEDSDRAFHPTCDLWLDDEERQRAREMAETIGRSLYRPAPLGYGDGQYLVVFYHNVPNNSLPILHRSGRYLSSEWRPLFPSGRR
jgi:tetratricopeptide (TPR) repeat protein